MTASLAHRGPDNDGFYDSAFCTLGHRRLRIIDLSPLGCQPMANEDSSLWLSFNGEIYNYLELRPELVRRGHQFRSQSDTEVMLHLYEEHGEAMLPLLNGMFALSLWDERRRRLLLARDRFGKKPLYYWTDGRKLLFASELKAILEDPDVPRELNFEALSAYLSLGYVPSPLTIFRGVKKLPPASYLTVDVQEGAGGENRLRLAGPERYWTLRYAPDVRLTEQDCAARIRELLRDAVRIRMFSDVPLGAFLSGGLDSSAVVAAMSEVSERPVETFSIGFNVESYDESPFAEAVARKFRTNHHTYRCSPDALEVLPTLVHHFDEPFADASAIPTYCVSRIARQLVTVALSGDGGDETFAGYERYADALAAFGRGGMLPHALRRGAFAALEAAYPQGWRGWGFLHRNALPPLEAYASSFLLFLEPQKDRLWSAEARDALRSAGNGVMRYFRRWGLPEGAQPRNAGELLDAMQHADQMLYLPEDILVKVDRASMAVSLEARAPLLDYRLAEFMATVPAELRFRGRVKKYLLKKAMEGVLPDEILHRGKQGFSVPLEKWFRGEARGFVRDVLLSQRLRERGLFDRSQLEWLLKRQDGTRRADAHRLWVLLFFELWCRAWLDRPPSPAQSPSGERECLFR
jgi:asparagine synthase (glutamine-hydrolysing)